MISQLQRVVRRVIHGREGIPQGPQRAHQVVPKGPQRVNRVVHQGPQRAIQLVP